MSKPPVFIGFQAGRTYYQKFCIFIIAHHNICEQLIKLAVRLEMAKLTVLALAGNYTARYK